MSILGRVLGILVLLAVLLLVIGVGAYASDYAVQGTVKETNCPARPPYIVVDVRIVGAQTVEVTSQQCGVLAPGNHVVYRLRSGHTTIYDREGGRCLYDSETGYGCGGAIVPGLG